MTARLETVSIILTKKNGYNIIVAELATTVLTLEKTSLILYEAFAVNDSELFKPHASIKK